MTAKNLKVGQSGIIKELTFEDKIQHHRMMDLGFLPNEPIKCSNKTFGSTAFEVKGTKYGIRNEDAEQIKIIVAI